MQRVNRFNGNLLSFRQNQQNHSKGVKIHHHDTSGGKAALDTHQSIDKNTLQYIQTHTEEKKVVKRVNFEELSKTEFDNKLSVGHFNATPRQFLP